MFVDTHAHLFYPNFKDDLDQVMQRAEENGVDYILVPATDLDTAARVIDLTEKYEMIYGAVGIHPHETKGDRKSTRLNSSHIPLSRMPSSA